MPVHSGHPHRHRFGRGPLGSDRIENLEREPQPVLQAAAVLVAAHVGQWRDEAAHQVAVGAVQLQEVKTAARRHPRRGDELLEDGVHVAAGHLSRHLADGQVGESRWCDQVPVSRFQRLVDPFPHELGRTLAPGMAELDADLRHGVLMNEGGQPRERRFVLRLVHPGATGCDSPFARHAHHLGHHQGRPSQSFAPQVHEVEVRDQPVLCGVHVHRRDDHAIGKLELAEAKRREHRRRRIVPVAEPAVDFGHKLRIAHLEVPVRHAAAAGEQVEGELERLLMRVLRDVLEPFEARLCGTLRALDHRPALGLVRG